MSETYGTFAYPDLERFTDQRGWMPIQRSAAAVEAGCPERVPFSCFEVPVTVEHALRIHDQTPRRLAERGGVSPAEAVGLLYLRDFRWVSEADEVECVKTLLDWYSGWGWKPEAGATWPKGALKG
jgi:hypothetical protein